MRKIANNYETRVKAVLKQFFVQTATMFDLDKTKKQPTDKELEMMIPDFPKFLNWAAESSRKHGIPVPYYSGPLTEEEMKAVEDRLSSIHTTIIKDDKSDCSIAISEVINND